MTAVPPALKRLSDDGACVDENDIKLLTSRPCERMTVVTELGKFERRMVQVTLRDRLHWADRVTGTLYDVHGTCRSSTRLWIERP